MSTPIAPLRERPVDVVFVVICAVFVLTTFLPDITSVLQIDLTDLDALRRDPPLWPPLWVLTPLVEYAEACDLLMLHNPPWFQAIMWGDIFVLGPYYVAAIVAFTRGGAWIRLPTVFYAAHVLTCAPILAAAHLTEPWLSPNPAMVLGFYLPYWLLPLALLWRLRHPQPFRRPIPPRTHENVALKET